MNPLYGIYAGIVVSAADPQGQGRARVQIPQLMGLEVAGWAEPVVSGAVLPGDRVKVAFEGGDIHSPLFWPKVRSGAQQWVPLALDATWTAEADSGLGAPVVRLGGDGVIELGGAVRPAFTPTPGTSYTVAALPVGLVPRSTRKLWCTSAWRSSSQAVEVCGYRAGQDSTSTSDTWVSLTGGPSVDFWVPPSGAVLVSLGAYMESTAARALMGFRLKQGVTVTRTPQLFEDVAIKQIGGAGASVCFPVTGLTAGQKYTAEAQYKTSTADVANFLNRFLRITPVDGLTTPMAQLTLAPDGALSVVYPPGVQTPYVISLDGYRARAV